MREVSKCSLIKHTCPWPYKLIVLGTLKRQAKIFLRGGQKFIAGTKLMISSLSNLIRFH